MTTLSKQAAFGTYSPAAIGWSGKWDPEKDRDLLVPFTFDGVSYGSMHKLVVPIFTDLFAKLVPLIPGGLIKGQCGCFNPGSVTVGGDRSFHTYGIATDTNWGHNPMYHHGRPKGRFALPAKTSSIAHSMGCEWGGDWSYPEDWMHIEVHLSPDECRAYARARKPVQTTPVTPPAPKEFTVDAEAKKRFDLIDLKLAQLESRVIADGRYDIADGKYDLSQLKKLDALQSDVAEIKAALSKPRPGA